MLNCAVCPAIFTEIIVSVITMPVVAPPVSVNVRIGPELPLAVLAAIPIQNELDRSFEMEFPKTLSGGALLTEVYATSLAGQRLVSVSVLGEGWKCVVTNSEDIYFIISSKTIRNTILKYKKYLTI